MFRRWRSQPFKEDDSSSQDAKHEVAHEGETGKVSRANFHDRMGRPVLIMRPGMQVFITQPSSLFSVGPQKTVAGEGNISHLVYLVENAILNLPEGQEQMSWLVDFTGWSINTNVPIKIARDIIYTLQNHYPERLAIIILYNPSRIFEAFHKIVKYFVDQKTSQKIKFVYPNKKASVEIVKSLFDNENLPSEFGGNGTLKYDHEEFSKLMVQDDAKTAKFWGFDNEQSRGANGHVGAEVAPEPASMPYYLFINISVSNVLQVEELRAGIGTLSGRSAKFCTDACLRRYLEARSWNVHEVAHEGETGKVSRANFHDREGRPVLIMRPGMQKTVAGEGNVSHLVYLIENAILNLPEGQEQMSWLIDFNGWSINTNVPIRIAREIINTLQNHYPERLAIIILYNPPRIFEAFYKIVKYFVDPKTSQKIKFVYPNNKASVEIVKSLFDSENLPSEFGGKATLKYDHEEFSRLMVQDDVKSAKFWGFDNEQSHDANRHVGAEVAPEPVNLAPPAN
ncbi:hypothetical protein RJ640_011117 [Escallonia rubra]|uniref:CRAL-TRIO domain-containing protein n=1 Tax=Escallonia rubra TaxID=112253 RepID=A0AA88UNC2_9ASTE|nr:hypothetical protein RJ640_011117 [Escallonia rubra]